MNTALFLLFLLITVVSFICAIRAESEREVVNMPELDPNTGHYNPHYREIPKDAGLALLGWFGFVIGLIGMFAVWIKAMIYDD